jgi:hypothetical protein
MVEYRRNKAVIDTATQYSKFLQIYLHIYMHNA